MFAKEKEMTEVVKEWLRPQVTAMETELYCGFAGKYVPDIVGICFDREKVSTIKRQNPMARGRIRKLLKEKRMPLTYHTDMIAIELKLTRFTQAFFQAAIYSHFGFRPYIAMPEPRYFNLSGLQTEVLRNMGIGFLSVNKKGCDEYIKAKKSVNVSLEDEIQIADRLICRFKGG